MFAQSISGVLDETVKALGLASIIYPLERVQSIKQIQSTFSDPEIRQHKSIVSMSLHYGLKSYFRGYMPFITKMGLLNISTKVTEIAMKNRPQGKEGLPLLTFGFATLGYFLTYPLELVNMRMSTEVERERFYISTRQCISKIKKNEGIKTLYRGFAWGYSIFALQLAFLNHLQNEYMQQISHLTQWQKIGAVYGAIGASEILLYPLISLKKIYQINGAIGHTDQNYNIRSAFRHSKLTSLWRGCETRLINISAYSLLYFLLFDQQQLH